VFAEYLVCSAAIVVAALTWARLSKASSYFDLGDWVQTLQS
jgi:hypothetical protein